MTGRPPKYPWRKMKVGDEFAMSTKMISSARNMASSKSADLRKAFQVRKELDGTIMCRRIR